MIVCHRSVGTDWSNSFLLWFMDQAWCIYQLKRAQEKRKETCFQTLPQKILPKNRAHSVKTGNEQETNQDVPFHHGKVHLGDHLPLYSIRDCSLQCPLQLEVNGSSDLLREI